MRYCEKCSIPLTNETTNTCSSYCNACRKLLGLSPDRLGDYQPVPENQVRINGDYYPTDSWYRNQEVRLNGKKKDSDKPARNGV